ncbi:hypothetical protein Goari_002920, partial [Gossypium aridum]|nr:hypothetical protein [Gossypium aridum]
MKPFTLLLRLTERYINLLFQDFN